MAGRGPRALATRCRGLRDTFFAVHSMTFVACSSIACGILTPRALVVFKLMTQGYDFSKALPAAEFLRLLQAGHAVPTPIAAGERIARV